MLYQCSTLARCRLLLLTAILLPALVVLLLHQRPAQAQAGNVLRVDANSPCASGCDGASWDTAYPTLQDALDAASAGDELWLADGVYYPDRGAGQSKDDRTASFQLLDDVALYGGFEGSGGAEETVRDQRDWKANVTVLSGDVGTAGLADDNSYHVVTGSGANAGAVLDGFTVSAGRADGSHPDDDGAGLFNAAGSPTLANLLFSSNYAGGSGGGLYNGSSGNPTLTNVRFSDNEAGLGGGLYNEGAGSDPSLSGVTFSGNLAQEDGGGLWNEDGDPALTGATFSNNVSHGSGGGLFSRGGLPTLTNATFLGNQTDGSGGGINGNATLTNVVVAGNRADGYGGGILHALGGPTLTNVTVVGNSAGVSGGGLFNDASSPTIQNSIFWNNEDQSGLGTAEASMYNNDLPEISLESNPTTRYSLLQGSGGSSSWDEDLGTDGGHNVDVDPLLVSPMAPGDAPTTSGDLHLQAGSPAIDAGDNGSVPSSVPSDADGRARFVDIAAEADTGAGTPPIVDLGALEFQHARQCGVSDGNTYLVNDYAPITVTVAGAGALDCITVAYFNTSHPQATAGLQTGHYWRITGQDAQGDAVTGGFDVTLTLPTDFTPDGDDKVCRYDEGADGWECAATSFDAAEQRVTRANVTHFSDWAVGDDVGPTTISLAGSEASPVVLFPPLVLALILLLGFSLAVAARRTVD